MALLWLAVLLTLICRSMTTDHAISDPDPITNLRIDPQRKRLVWEQHGNVSKIACYVNSKPLTEAKGNQCTLGDLSCEVKNYTVKVMKGQPFSAWIQYPKQGNPRAAADNLTCRVHDVDQLSCSWAVGKEAPADVQYYFCLETWPCPKYMQNQQGVNVQCHFDSISLKPQLQSHTLFRFLVNGTSGGSKIPCRETLHRLQEIEILAAPNITKTWCNKNYSFMEWEVKSLFTEDLKYELEIQKGTDLPYKKETELKTFMLRNPGPYTVKVKAMDSMFFRRRPQGQWSAPQHLVRRLSSGDSCWVSLSSAPKPHLLSGPRPHPIPDLTQQENLGHQAEP
ncbi:interleukin-3 receptor subunit alpha isoform X2 [Cervus elaphus]|uniref:interleukin-3 receptor subunit alpha isoform X2 n=1 Tax=Cervus elaphus TaxID=9860 RepID=UPI001CC30C4E|nr:interleukin-3 receptor subunit alpha isoform X2 [Cervus elaphus]